MEYSRPLLASVMVQFLFCEMCRKFRDNEANSTSISHSRKKLFPCSVCGEWFAQLTALVSHTRIHSGEKLYKCHVCVEAFRCGRVENWAGMCGWSQHLQPSQVWQGI